MSWKRGDLSRPRDPHLWCAGISWFLAAVVLYHIVGGVVVGLCDADFACFLNHRNLDALKLRTNYAHHFIKNC